MKTQNKSISYRSFSSSQIADLLMESITDLHSYAAASGYQISGDFPERRTLLASLEDKSFAMQKRLLRWHFALQRKRSMRSANRFLHFLCVKVLGYGSELQVPRIDYSEKEQAIRSARASWVQARDEAEVLRLVYAAEKGDFYKT